MRQIFLDTETTGLESSLGHRILEIAGVEMKNRRLTGKHLHFYINPEREIDASALEIHGLTQEFLEDKPKFAEIAGEFRAFITGAELVIHNAPFDVAFLNMEFARLDLSAVEDLCPSTLDTLKLARELHPGKRNNLDALCERYQVNNARRTLHGALLDAELLADVYLAMTRGQESLLAENVPNSVRAPQERESSETESGLHPRSTFSLRVLRATEAERDAHQKILENIDKESQSGCIWKRTCC
ncbi:MAG: DNA polymerase III subunit epsilon [Zoogloeaceae bacterium]|jgi:DNA polymerase-3 subunit epsilon|nr:DNA polymerase III subunit epsilon [Zoogloeaceae bacterium]